MAEPIIKALFLDVGGVLMTNGWDHLLRRQVAEKFGVEVDEMSERHHLVFDTYETGKLSFDEYLNRVVFYKPRTFTLEEYKTYIFDAVRPFPEMLEYVKSLRAKYNLKIGIVSNEGRELAEDRIQRFRLSEFVDFFVISSFVHFRKPDPDIFKLAIDVAQVAPSEIVYIENTLLLVEVAQGLGINGLHYTAFEATKKALERYFI